MIGLIDGCDVNFRPSVLNPAGPTALAQEADFRLGNLSVSPSRLEVCAGETRETIQPRVMQVLTLLARRRGEAVSRDDLIAICWGGRSVSEDAINRSIAGVRRLAESSGAFSIETVRRVGYRLEQTVPPVEAAPCRSGNVVLAVLAFDNLSKDADLEFFSEGVSEEIQQTVARSAELIVIGRSSSFQFRGADKAAARIASVLKATHVLDGSVRRSENRVRISASLIECTRETTLWSRSFDRELSDVFALQDEIAAAVAAALKVAVLPSVQAEVILPAQKASERSQIDPSAYTAYLQGRFYLNRRNRADMHRAVNFFKEALAIVPDSADARASLALTYASLVSNGQSPQCLPLARQETEAALRLAPNHFEALVARASVSVVSWKWSEAHGTYRQLLARHPNDARVHHYFGWFLTMLQLPELWLRAHRRAAALDPLVPVVRFNIGEALRMLGREEEAIPEYLHALTLDPDMTFTLRGLCAALASTGRLEEAKSVLRERLVVAAGAEDFYAVSGEAMIACRETGGIARLHELARDAERDYPTGSANAALVGLIHAFADDFEALKWFQRAIDEHDVLFFYAAAEPLIPVAFKTDPRWRSFMQQPALQEWARVRREVANSGI
ncbi:MAG TPA: winged helix-turn-helix domain-containing protein [Rhizomicrobium sp.]|jgi:TolB-like protein/tetratricopeptide (TPR) repeat protein|nr:winged helix-turn-helix domain-containing protein [Rhizomicrobium sp.]